MAYPDAVASRFGQANSSGPTDALFLKVWAGETLAAFLDANIFLDKHVVRTIASGKSAQFPNSWKGGSQYHTPGAEIVGMAVAHNERVIAIDSLLIADRFLASIDEAMNHFDVRSLYTTDAGRALARQFDRNLAQVIVLAARTAANITGANGGTVITATGSKTSASTLVDGIVSAAQVLDEKDVPSEDRFCALAPSQYYQIVNSSTKALNRDYNRPEGNGSFASGDVFSIAGIKLVKSNHMPTTNVTTGPAAYQGNFTNTTAFVWQKMAVGTVKLMDLAVEGQYEIRRQGHLIVAKYAMGHGVLRPECSIEIANA